MADHISQLRESSEYTEIDFLGERRGFCLTVLGARYARRDMQIDFVKRVMGVLGRVAGVYQRVKAKREAAAEGEEAEADATEGAEGNEAEFSNADMLQQIEDLELSTRDLEAFGAALYAGLRPFNDDIEPDDVLLHLTIGKLKELVPEVGPHIFSFMRDQMDEDVLPDAEDVEDGEAAEADEDTGKKS